LLMGTTLLLRHNPDIIGAVAETTRRSFKQI
jgi:hypothetical protein